MVSIGPHSREKSTDDFYDVTKTWLTAEHDISAGNTAKVSNTAGDGTHTEATPAAAAIKPTNTGLDHTVLSQAQTPMDDSGTTSIADTPMLDTPDVILDFDLSMPSMLNFQAAGLRRSARIAAQESKSNIAAIRVNLRTIKRVNPSVQNFCMTLS